MTRAILLAALGAVLCLSTAFAAAPEREVLPAGVTPQTYRIAIVPDVAALTFKGSVAIDLEVTEPTDRIVLNSVDLAVASAALSGVKAAPKIEYDTRTERVAFVFPAALKPGAYTLTIAYGGKIYETSSGLFVTPYSDNGQPKTMLTTQFEPGAARRLAPMWDEPAIKAVFEMSMTIPAAETAISNMPVVATDAVDGGMKRVRFAPSPKMSSYLLFVASGELERISAVQGSTDIGIVTRRGEGPRAQYALDISGPILDYYNDYFGVAYPLPKLDQIGAPGAGGFGAMENWGAIFYFESALLVDPSLTTETDRQRIYGTIAHEMAHQWFGDLVTMSWWDDLWLNEGFASWMQKKAAEKFNPSWNVWLQAIKTQQQAMAPDSRGSTHPVIQPVASVAEAELAFDDITYNKGQSVIRMLEAYLGEDAFRDGVRRYMKQHAYGNTVTDDLWTALEAASETPVVEIARDFTTQPGIPLLIVESVTCKDGASEVSVRQERFGFDEASKAKLRWRVPVVAASIGSTERTRAVVDGKAILTVPGCGAVRLNAGNTSYFRTLYPADVFTALAAGFARLADDDQLGLLYDTWALAAAGYQPVGDYLSLSRAVHDDADPMVWLQVVNTYSDIADLYRGQPGADGFTSYARARLQSLMLRIGWETSPSEPPNVGILRDALIELMAKLDDPAVIAEAERRFDAFATDPAVLPGGIRRAALRAVAMHADNARWQALRALAAAAPSPLEQRLYLDAMTYVRDPALAQKTLDLAVSGETPKQLSPRLIKSVADRHPDLAWTFLQTNEAAISERIDDMQSFSFIPDIAATSADPKRAGELKSYFRKRLPGAPEAEMKRSMDEIKSDGDIRANRLPQINEWLSRTQ